MNRNAIQKSKKKMENEEEQQHEIVFSFAFIVRTPFVYIPYIVSMLW